MADAKKDSGISPAAAGIAAGLAGVAIGAAAVAMSDKKTRGKVMKQVDNFKGMAEKQIGEIKSGIDELRSDVAGKVDEGVEEVKEIAKESKK